ncbi:MAG TPA: Fic family protein [Candidatus Microsaccharimonas sp.]|jgi:cell filamentation protein
MPYDITGDPYIDPKIKILRNRLGAKTQAKLDKAESEITYIAILTLTKGSKPDSFVFNTTFLADIHKEIFKDIYSWAGEYRTYDISKGSSYFAHAAYIVKLLDELLVGIEKDTLLQSDDVDIFTERITHYYSELNAIHPFREGNGRALRTFLRLLALKYGYDIEWEKMDQQENVVVSEQSLGSSNDGMLRMMTRLVIKIA